MREWNKGQVLRDILPVINKECFDRIGYRDLDRRPLYKIFFLKMVVIHVSQFFLLRFLFGLIDT